MTSKKRIKSKMDTDDAALPAANYSLLLGDCLERMAEIPDGSVDLVLTDPPYGTTACKWDAVIPFEPMWEQVWRVLKPNGAAVFTASQPFTSALVMSNAKAFRYCWIWAKNGVTNVANAKKMPLRNYEDIAVFYRSSGTYNPQGLIPYGKTVNKGKSAGGQTTQGEEVGNGKGALRSGADYVQEFTNYPRQILNFDQNSKGKIHPTQKPVALMEYLIRTYTNPGETVLDFTMGSGTTGVACLNTGRKFIGIERDPEYFRVASERISEAERKS